VFILLSFSWYTQAVIVGACHHWWFHGTPVSCTDGPLSTVRSWAYNYSVCIPERLRFICVPVYSYVWWPRVVVLPVKCLISQEIIHYSITLSRCLYMFTLLVSSPVVVNSSFCSPTSFIGHFCCCSLVCCYIRPMLEARIRNWSANF